MTAFNRAVLRACRDLGREARGLNIYHAITEALGRDVAIASVYIAIEELAEAQLVTTRREPGGPERGGRAVLYAHPTRWGLAELEERPGNGRAALAEAERAG